MISATLTIYILVALATFVYVARMDAECNDGHAAYAFCAQCSAFWPLFWIVFLWLVWVETEVREIQK